MGKCFIFSSIIEIKHSHQRQLWRGKDLFHITLPGHSPSLKEFTAGSERQEPKGENHRGVLVAGSCFIASL